MIAGRDTQHSPNRVETLPTGFRYRTGFALGRVLMLTNLTWRNVAILIAAIAIASGCIAWGIIVATDQSGLHKAVVTVVPLKVGRGAPID